MIRCGVVCFCHTHEWNLLKYKRRFIKERSMVVPSLVFLGESSVDINPSN